MDEQIQGVETPVISEPVTAHTPVATSVGQLMDAQEQSEPTGDQSPSVEPQPSERTDTRDFRGMAKAKEAEAKEFKQLYRDAQSKIEQLEQQVVPPTLVGAPEEEALQLLKNVVRETVDEAISPLRSSFAQQQEERILTEFQSQPFVKELGPEITQELQSLSPEVQRLPLEKRLAVARANAIASNIDVITRVSRDIGIEQAYANQDLKREQVGSGQRPNQGMAPPENLLERLQKGQVSNKEWAERKSEIDQILKEEALGSS